MTNRNLDRVQIFLDEKTSRHPRDSTNECKEVPELMKIDLLISVFCILQSQQGIRGDKGTDTDRSPRKFMISIVPTYPVEQAEWLVVVLAE